MRILILLAAALFSAACASKAPPPADPVAQFGGAAVGNGITVVGTLATVGSADELTAAPLTRLELLAKATRNDIVAGRITPAQADAVRGKIGAARDLLDNAVQQFTRGNKVAGLLDVNDANKLLAEGEDIRRGVRSAQ
jgi:hypothetical protein